MEAHTVLARAAVHLERILVGEDVDLDAAPLAGKRSNGSAGAPVVGAVLGAVDEVCVVVAGAVEAAVTQDLGRREVGAELLRAGPEVVD